MSPIIYSREIEALLASRQTTRSPSGWSSFGGPQTEGPVGDFSLILFCNKCNVNTSGIYRNPGEKSRYCPSCSSLLMYCPRCQRCTSGTERFGILCCDGCKEEFVTNTTIAELMARESKSREIVISGIRATGQLHLGNYLGAIKPFVELQKGDNLCLIFIADWHTLTTSDDAEALRNNCREIALDYLASGLDPERSIIYAQSSVPEIAEISLYLSMFQKENEIHDLPTIKELKDKRKELGKPVTMGLLMYPVLMAADILGARATLVPVGLDQVPNVEIARRLADRVNRTLGPFLTKPRGNPGGVKVPSLTGGKMGKSEQGATILLTDDLASIERKYARFGVTDANKLAKGSPGNPLNCISVFPLYKIIAESDPELIQRIESECVSGSRGCGDCKKDLAKMVYKLLTPFRERRAELVSRRSYVEEVLHFGGLKAREIFQPTLEEFRSRLGIIRP